MKTAKPNRNGDPYQTLKLDKKSTDEKLKFIKNIERPHT